MNDNKIKCMYYNRKFTDKPQGKEAGGIQFNLKQTEISIPDLAMGLANGTTFMPALLNGRGADSWVQQQFNIVYNGYPNIIVSC